MSPTTLRTSRLFSHLSAAFALLLAGCGVAATEEGDVDASTDESLGTDEAALYQGWVKAPREVVYVGHPAPQFCGDGKVKASEACDDGNHTDGDGCSQSCTIESGYACAGNPSACADIDECTAPTAVCGKTAICQNLPGSYSCNCKAGFEGDGLTCSDVDECALGLDACSANALCINRPGDHACLCDAGFTGDGITCTDIDECASNPCHDGAVCSNNPGGFKCLCAEGYEGADGACTDVDECADGTAACAAEASCDNTDGGYECTCREYFKGDGFNCDYVGKE